MNDTQQTGGPAFPGARAKETALMQTEAIQREVTLEAGADATPVVAFVDVVTIPTRGGEDGHGGYFRVFGWNFGPQADLGAATQVFVGGIEVANYRYLLPSVTHAKTALQEIAVQIGAVGGAANGTALPVTVVRNGLHSNADATVMPCKGRVLFVALDGDDAAAQPDDIAAPWRHLQTSTPAPDYVVDGGVSLVLEPGDQVVLRGGEWKDIAFESAWFRYRLDSNQAQPKRWHHFTAYPGPILAHSPELVHYTTPPGAKGGLQGPGSSYAGTTGDYVSVSCLTMEVDANATSDAAPVNLQNAYGPWRVAGCELGPWPSAINAKAAGVSGHGDGVAILGNHIHGFHCEQALENHGIYADSGARNWEIAFNWIEDISGGNLIQFFDNTGLASGDQANMPTDWPGFTGMRVHHNWLEGSAKYGVNLSASTLEVDLFTNVIVGSTYAALRTDISYPTQAVKVNVIGNTFYDCDRLWSGSGNGQFLNSSGSGKFPAGSLMLVQQNIFAAGPSTLAESMPYANNGSDAPWQVRTQNVWYGPYQSPAWNAGNSGDPDGIFGDPQFTDAAAGDFTLGATSTALDAATLASPFPLTTDFTGVTPRPQGAERDVGAFERPSDEPPPSPPPPEDMHTVRGTFTGALTGTFTIRFQRSLKEAK